MDSESLGKIKPMTERKNLPTRAIASELVLPTENSGSLVTRGLAAVCAMNERQLSLSPEANAERLFKLGMRYRYPDDIAHVDDNKARRYFLEASELDHAEAQFELFWIISENAESEKQQDEADRWLSRSANLGFGPALWQLSEDPSLPEEQCNDLSMKALAWYRASAAAGDARWQFEYAKLLKTTPRLKGDSEEWLRWCKASAEQDYCRACEFLGYAYLHGEVTTYTTQQGIYWYSRAAELGDKRAATRLGELYLHGDSSDSYDRGLGRIPQRRILPDKQIAISWFERGFAMDDRHAAYALGKYYLDGKLLDQDIQLAEKWLLRAADAESSDAQIVLGKEYASGARLRQDADSAIHWLRLAAGVPRMAAGLTLAEIYLEGAIVPKDLEEAIKWLNVAAGVNSDSNCLFPTDAMKLVAAKCFDGRFNAPEQSVAQSWLAQMAARTLKLVADMESPAFDSNALHLAELYELGLGVEQDRDKAIYWYKQSAARHYGARARLKTLGIDWTHT